LHGNSFKNGFLFSVFGNKLPYARTPRRYINDK
jgi:hypothetical protein